jgi:hypothetical protein
MDIWIDMNNNRWTRKRIWYCGWVDENDEKCLVEGSFIEVEYKYFEGFNLPREIIDGKSESFDKSYKRMQDWMNIPLEHRSEASKPFRSYL